MDRESLANSHSVIDLQAKAPSYWATEALGHSTALVQSGIRASQIQLFFFVFFMCTSLSYVRSNEEEKPPLKITH